MGVIRGFVVEHLAPPVGGLAVAALDESGQEKKGSATAGVKRQYMGCAGQVANGVNTVLLLVSPPGWARPGRRPALPARRAARRPGPAGRARASPTTSSSGTKPQLAMDIVTDMACRPDDARRGSPATRSTAAAGQLRDYIEEQRHRLRACASAATFRVELTPVTRLRADALVATHLTGANRWKTRSVPAPRATARYAWAWLATVARSHHLLIRRKHLTSGELAYHYCYVPPGRPITLHDPGPGRVPAVAGRGRSSSSARTTSVSTTARSASTPPSRATSCSPWPPSPSARSPPPPDTRTGHRPLPTAPRPATTPRHGLIAFTVAEIKRLFNLITRHRPRRRPPPALGHLATTPPSPRPLVPPPHPTPTANQ